MNAARRAWYKKDHSKSNAQKRRYYAKNKKKFTAQSRARKLRQLNAMPKWADKKAIAAFYKACPPGWHCDHIVPITSQVVCGLHHEANLQLLPAMLNLSKSNRFEVTIGYDPEELFIIAPFTKEKHMSEASEPSGALASIKRKIKTKETGVIRLNRADMVAEAVKNSEIRGSGRNQPMAKVIATSKKAKY